MTGGYLREGRARPAPRAGQVFATEHQEQCAVVDWWALACKGYCLPEFALYAVPNAGAGAQKGQAGKMKAEGVRPGIQDLNLDAARGGYHGLRIEMKSSGPHARVSPDQRVVHAYMKIAGYGMAVCWNSGEAIDTIKAYLAGAPT